MPPFSIQVLAVDDEAEICTLTKHYLEISRTMEVDTVHSVREAMDMLTKKRYDVIVSDFQMPEEDGIHFLKSLRAAGDGTPFILFTGKGREEVVIEALNNGADSYLQKGGKSVPQYAELEHRIQVLVKRHQGEVALRESEQRYRTILNQAADGIIMHDETGRIIDLNRKICTSLGYSRKELLAMSIGDIDPDAIRNGMDKLWKEILEGRNHTFESHLIRKDGSIIPVEVTLGSVQLPLGLAILGIIRDITERKLAEKELLKSEKQYRLIANNMADVVSVMDLDLRFTYVSPSIINLRGFTAEEAIGQSIDQALTPASVQLVLSVISQEMELEASGRADPNRTRLLELEEYRKDGSIIWVNNNLSFMRDEQGQPMAIIVLARDITERKRAEEALRESEGEFRSLFEENPDAVSIIGMDGKVLKCNLAAASMLDMCKEDIIGTSFADLGVFSAEDIVRFRRIILGLMEGESMPPFVHQILLRNGKVKWSESHSSAMMREGRFYATQIITRDITELKNTEIKLNSMSEQANLKMEHFLSPDDNIEEEGLANIIDAQELQSLMDDFYALTSIGIAIIDLKGNVLVANGWQDICTKFHRVHPESSRNCIESDIHLTQDLRPGEYRAYQCKNGMWDIATPIFSEKKHLGNIFFGQFFFDDQVIDTALFAAQAEKYGFDKEKYLDALAKVPRWSKEMINRLMDFYSKFASMVSHLSYSNLKFAKTLGDYDRAEKAIRNTQAQLRIAMDLAKLVHWEYDVDKDLFTFDDQFYALYGSSKEKEGGQLMSSAAYATRFLSPEEAGIVAQETGKAISTTDPNYFGQVTHSIIRSDGEQRIITVRFGVIKDATGRTVKTFGANQDITELKRAEKALEEANRKLKLLSSITRHDINNQLMTLAGNLTLLEKKQPDLTTDDNLLKAEAAATRISAMIQFTKEYEDIGITAPIWQNARDLVARAERDFTLDHINLVNDVSPVAEVYADPLIVKVFHNLIDNAVRHGDKITTIRFYVGEKDGIHAIICEDDGIGISSDMKKELFTHDSGKDHGFGLFLSREILAITGITIYEDGEPGKGARFEITIPVGGWDSNLS